MNKTIITLQKGFVWLPDDGMDNRKDVATVQANLMAYGYMLTEDAFLSMAKSDTSNIIKWHDEAISFLKEKMGGKHNNKPLYPNFPQEVMSLSDSELYWNALRHYWSNGKWSPKPLKMEKPVKFETITYNLLKSGTESDFLNIFTRLTSLNTSLTPTDMEVIKWFVNTKQKLVFPDSIPFKENLCTLAAMGLNVPVKTPTDVLRIAVHMSGGDISLPSVPKKLVAVVKKVGYRRTIEKENNPERLKFRFKKFKRRERKYLLGLLEKTHCSVAEMVLKSNRWVKLGEILHPGDYKDRFPKALKAFTILRRGLRNNLGKRGRKLNDKKAVSWYGVIERAFDKSFEEGIKKLSERPGEYLRRLDYLIRNNQKSSVIRKGIRNIKGTIIPKESKEQNMQLIFTTFRDVAKGSSNKVLFEVYSHFQGREKPVVNRSIFIKGARKRTELPPLPAIDKEVIEEIGNIVFSTLREKFAELPSLGNCYIDERLKNIPLPTNMRSTAFSLKPVVRGTRIPFDNPDAKVIRAFVHWYNDGKRKGGCDIDLSGILFNSTGTKKDNIGWNGRSYNTNLCTYSGDVTDRQGACAEYIDLNVSGLVKLGWKYAIIDIRDYRYSKENGGIGGYKDCVFGVMEREFPEANNNWKPDTIKNASSITSNTAGCLVAGIDLETKEYFMIDMDIDGHVASQGMDKIFSAMMNCAIPPKFSVYDLLLMHVEARGRIVLQDSPKLETSFLFEDFVHSYEKAAEYMV